MTSDVVVSVNKFTESWVNILVSHTWKSTDNNAWLAGVEELHVEVKRRFDEEKIPFAVPARDIRVRPDAPAGNAGTPA
jgi:small-conductance mechanosensitive channel